MKGDDDEDEEAGSIGVARYPCMPSLVALQQMRNRLQLAHLGRKLMKWTALATGKEMRRLALELDEASKSFHDDCKNAYIQLARCRYCFPGMNHFVLESVPHHPLTAHVKITTTVRTVTAVKCMVYTVVKLDRDPYDMFMVGRGGEQCLETRQTWFDLLLSIINWLQLRACFQAAEAAHLSATKKSKVLGKVVIPKINETIAYILSEMEERAREEFFRMKKIIQVKAKRSKKEDKVVPEELPEPPVPPPVEEPPPEPPVPVKKPCPHVCVRPEEPLVVEDVLSEEAQEEELEFIPDEPAAEPEPEPPCGWGALPSAQVGSGKPTLVPKTPPIVTPKPSSPGRPCGRPSPVSTRPSVRIIIPSESEEIVEKVSTYEEKTYSKTVSKITTARSMPEVPTQPLERTIQVPVCRVCKSCRPRPQCKHKAYDGDVCKLCQICCKTPNEDQFSEVIILGDGYEEQFEPEETVTGIVQTERAESVMDGSLKFEEVVSINTIGSIGDLSLENNASYTSDPIYKIESSETTTVRKIVKRDGTVIQEKEVTKVTMETVPEDLERRQSYEINAQIAELQKSLCKTCFKNEEPKESKSVTASAAENIAEGAEWSNVKQKHTKESRQEVQFKNICKCANCPEPDKMETICLCKTTDLPNPNDPAKCSYEWSCGGAIPECSIRKKKKKEDGDVNSREQE